jgi:hypothetical protein
MKIRVVLIGLALIIAVSVQMVAQDGTTSTLGKPIFPKLEYVNVNSELGFRTDVLRGFGARVDDARRDADAAAVAGLAVQLHFAELLATKKAPSVTALMLLEEAGRIAEEQQSSEAADAVALAARMMPSTESLVKRMSDSAALFASQRGEGEFLGFVRIANGCDRVLDIYIDGKFMGFQYDGDENVYSTGNGTTHARVTDAFGNTVSEILFVKRDETVTWTIKP